MGTVPARISWAIELLDAGPDDHVLEIGCGPGVSVTELAARVASVTALERSVTALKRVRTRNEAAVADGRVVLQHGELATLTALAAFDRALAVNVNVFWTGPATVECAALARALRPGGTLCLVYDRGDVGSAVADALARHGFAPEVLVRPDGLVGVRAVSRGPR